MKNIMLPLGVDNFEELRTTGYYYIDKTYFIEELIQERFKVHLITRPRRFGKTLAISMLADFFDIRKDNRQIFEGLAVSENKKLCREWRNQWPVLFVTLKDIEDLSFAEAYAQLVFTISNLCIEHSYLAKSSHVDSTDKVLFLKLKNQTADKAAVKNSLLILTRMMSAHFGKPVILLIDEYDVPLAKANEYGYYAQMLNSIRGMLSTALKNNRNLQFAVVTGCLRIAKESIFTGTNHFVANTIAGKRYKSVFGFTPAEVGKLLSEFGFEAQGAKIKQWYDGYRIDNTELYCPWDVLNYVSELKNDPDAPMGSYWKDTSHNDIIRSFIGQKAFNVTEQFETLLAGGCVKVKLCDTLTYDFSHSSEDNFWNILFLTGYLTQTESDGEDSKATLLQGEVFLKIPNGEIKTIFAETIVQWFQDNMRTTNRMPLMAALWEGKAELASSLLTDLLFGTISYHNYREDFYHAFLAGIFVGLGYAVESDKQHGIGRPDIVVKDSANRRAIILEIKHSQTKSAMEKDCETAVNQIAVQKYARDFLDGYKIMRCYGVSFFQKQCMVKYLEI